MRVPETNGDDAATHALQALAWILADGPRTDRFLGLTGIEPADLRARIDDPTFLGEVLAHLAGHEPDLVACAEALDVAPETLIADHLALEKA